MAYIYTSRGYVEDDQPSVMIENRGLRYADGFFETIRIYDGKALFLEHHFSRILESIKAYKMVRSINFTLQRLEKEIVELCRKNEISGGGRVRITFTRIPGGHYLPDSNDFEYIMEAAPLDINRFQLNEEGISVDIYPEMKKDINPLSIFKNIDSTLYVMASIYAKENDLSDALIQNYKGGIIESSNSNLFLVSNGVLYTSTLDDGPVAGIMRMQVINMALEQNIKIYECTLNPQNLLAADELFLTNAVKGVQWVSSYRTKRYFNTMSQRLINTLNEVASSR